MSSSLFFIIPLLVGVVTFVFMFAQVRDPLVALLTSAAGAMLGLLVVTLLSAFPAGESNSTETYPLKTVGTGVQVEGRSSFLMGGYMDSSPSYRFMMEVPGEGDAEAYNEAVEARIADVKVYETNSGDPTVTVSTKKTTNWFGEDLSVSYSYEVRVPEGSIVESTDIDFSK